MSNIYGNKVGSPQGMKELYNKMQELGAALEVKVIRSAAMSATLPTVRAMQAAAPRARGAYRTYKGRLVGPGFVGRSVTRKSSFNKQTGRVIVLMGVRREAFHGVTFLDKGLNVTSRKGKAIKPYSIKASNWFQSRFEGDTGPIVDRFKAKLLERFLKLR